MTETKHTPRIYLAGPDVFLADANELAEAKKAICAEYGLEGVWPLDNTLNLKGMAPPAAGLAIAQANENLMQECDAIIANLTPWDGPSADVGTAFELGFMRALGKPCFAYSNDVHSFEQRMELYILDHDKGPIVRNERGEKCAANGRMIESFQLNDNLMLDSAVHMSGGSFCLSSVPAWTSVYYTDLTAFRSAVIACAKKLGVTQKGKALQPEAEPA